ncbi:ATP-dependent DNA helicase Q4, partial [Podila clonocystis]
LWVDKRWRQRLISIVVDEIHCVDTWAGFRASYPCIGTLRSKVPGVPIVGLTATLTPKSFDVIKKHVYLSSSDIKVIRVEDIRDNIRIEVHIFAAQNRVRLLAKLLDKTKTIVYFDNTTLLRRVQDSLREMRPDLQIDAYFSVRVTSAKDKAMLDFIDSKIDVLLATDACGMGCDISDVITVIQYE